MIPGGRSAKDRTKKLENKIVASWIKFTWWFKDLFGIEDELGISAIFWYKLIYQVGGMADYAERVGNRLRLLTAN